MLFYNANTFAIKWEYQAMNCDAFAMFSLDVIEPGRSVGDIIIGLIMHNIPVFILTGLLIIAWKHELVGAITFITAGLLYSGLTVFRAIHSERY